MIVMLLDDNDVGLLARGNNVQIETRDPLMIAAYLLRGSAAVIAEIKRYHKVVD